MERGDQLRAAIVVDPPAQAGDRIFVCSSVLRGERAERDDDLRLDRRNLPEEERLALLDLVRLGVAVVRRPALQHVRDVDVARG